MYICIETASLYSLSDDFGITMSIFYQADRFVVSVCVFFVVHLIFALVSVFSVHVSSGRALARSILSPELHLMWHVCYLPTEYIHRREI